MLPTTIDDVIAELTEIIEWAKANKSRKGYFPALYRKVTIAVKEGIENGDFEDGPRMERLDVLFANRYLEAFRQYQAGERPTESWQLTFETTEQWWPIVLQHLLLGINAHISLDLGIAAAETVGDQPIESLKKDFFKINDLLASMVDDVKDELAQIWPLLRFFDLLVGKYDDYLAKFGIEYARDNAWRVATKFAGAPQAEWPALTEETDRKTLKIGKVIRRPSIGLRLAFYFVRLGEMRRVRRIIEILE